MECSERLQSYLRESNVPFQLVEHPVAYTAQEVAASEHVPGRMFAKVVMVVADGQLTMLVLPAMERVRLSEVQKALGAKETRLASEEEFGSRFPDCDVGAMPPFGYLYGVPMIVDASLARNERIVFQPGTHTQTMSVRYADYVRLVQPRIAEIGTVAEREPAGSMFTEERLRPSTSAR